jgi:pimeloyl-ACP methyl ester carboxylesterase
MRSALLALVLFSSACAADEPDVRPTLRDAQCPYDEPGMRCAYLDVPAKRSDPTSATLSLFVTILEAERAAEGRMPVVVLAGGPGGTSSTIDWEAHPVRERYDIVLLDQRGAGLSEPALNCGELEASDLILVGESIDDPARRGPFAEATRACRDRFLDRGVDLSAFNTEESAADIEDLRRALGVPQLNVRGGSYGTRLALEVMRSFPSSVRSAALFGTFPQPVDRFADLARNADAAIQAVFEACEQDDDCPRPDMREAFERRMAALDEHPLEHELDDGSAYYINAADAGALLFGMLYRSDEIVRLPHEALTFAAAAFYDDALAQDVPGSARGLYLSTTCREEYPFADRERALEAPAYLRTYRWDHSTTVAECEAWDVPPASPTFKEPVRSDVPTLLLVGRFDPITPPRYTHLAAETLSRSQVIELPGAGHDTQYYTPCVQDMLTAFFEDPSAEADTSCVDDELGPPDF